MGFYFYFYFYFFFAGFTDFVFCCVVTVAVPLESPVLQLLPSFTEFYRVFLGFTGLYDSLLLKSVAL